MISASVLRALMRCGSLLARSICAMSASSRAFRTIVLMKLPCRRTGLQRRSDSPSEGGSVSLFLWLEPIYHQAEGGYERKLENSHALLRSGTVEPIVSIGQNASLKKAPAVREVISQLSATKGRLRVIFNRLSWFRLPVRARFGPKQDLRLKGDSQKGALRLPEDCDSSSKPGASNHRYEPSDREWAAIKPMLPNKLRSCHE
jgi:hypothetical protein